MGFEDNRFDGNVDEVFRCSICHDIAEDPIVSNCDHIFCKLCINQWLQKENSCPVDRKLLMCSQLCETSIFFRNFYSKLIIKCEFESNGCENKCLIEELKSHQNKCEFNPIFKSKCEKGCEKLLTNNEISKHNCVQYLKSIITELKEDLNKGKKLESKQEELVSDFESMFIKKCDEIKILENKIKSQSSVSSDSTYFVNKCNTKWLAHFYYYKCNSCANSPESALCPKCFRNGNHSGHEYEIYVNSKGGFCKCGDELYTKRQGFCKNHGISSQIEIKIGLNQKSSQETVCQLRDIESVEKQTTIETNNMSDRKPDRKGLSCGAVYDRDSRLGENNKRSLNRKPNEQKRVHFRDDKKNKWRNHSSDRFHSLERRGRHPNRYYAENVCHEIRVTNRNQKRRFRRSLSCDDQKYNSHTFHACNRSPDRNANNNRYHPSEHYFDRRVPPIRTNGENSWRSSGRNSVTRSQSRTYEKNNCHKSDRNDEKRRLL